jgi:oxygen-dependent protoporphyrinogen oxidase
VARIAVIGGGVTGLAAAYEASRAGAEVVVLDGADRLGGKVRTSTVAGLAVDESADAFLARVPDGIELCRELGIDGELVSPAARRAYVYSHGALRKLPEEQVLGVPTDLDALAASGIVSAAAIERARLDLSAPGPPPQGDEAIGAFIRRRLGDEVLERLVDPLVGGINAGDTDDLSLAAVVPQLDAAARADEPSLIRACGAQRAAADATSPVFFAPAGGMGRIVEALASALVSAGVDVRLGDRATAQDLDDGGRTVVTAGERLVVDGVIVTTPAPVAAAVLRAGAPDVAAHLATIPYASVVLLTLVVPRDAIDHPLDGSGYLVPRPEGRLLTACSWASSKWAHLGHDPDTVVLRASAGRFGDERAMALSVDEVTRAVIADLRDTMAMHGQPSEVRVSYWPLSFPQYRPGHLDLVATIESELAASAPHARVTGAAMRGLGVPACIRQGREAARDLLATLD